MPYKVGPRALLYPTAVWIAIVGVLFATEYLIMMALPVIFAGEPSPLVEALTDSLSITLVLAPVIWLLLVRPLRKVIRLRTQLLSDLFTAIEIERRQTAYALHDGIGQELGLLISGLRSAEEALPNVEGKSRLHELQKLAESALSEARRVARGLRPSLLDHLGLTAAIEKVVFETMAHTPIQITLDAASLNSVRLPEPIETAIFRLFQEGLSNLLRYSGAAQASIAIGYVDREVILSIADDGRGFNPRELTTKMAAEGHTGIIGMRERVALLGGHFELHSSAGKGCQIAIRVPAEERTDV